MASTDIGHRASGGRSHPPRTWIGLVTWALNNEHEANPGPWSASRTGWTTSATHRASRPSPSPRGWRGTSSAVDPAIDGDPDGRIGGSTATQATPWNPTGGQWPCASRQQLASIHVSGVDPRSRRCGKGSQSSGCHRHNRDHHTRHKSVKGASAPEAAAKKSGLR